MAIRVQLPGTKQPTPTAAEVFSSDRAAALSRLVKPGTSPGLTPAGPVEIRGTTPAMPVPARLPAPVALKRALPSATQPGLPVPPPALFQAPERSAAPVRPITVILGVPVASGVGPGPALRAPEAARAASPRPEADAKSATARFAKWGAVFAGAAGVFGLAWYFLTPSAEKTPASPAPVTVSAKPVASGGEKNKDSPVVEVKRGSEIAPTVEAVPLKKEEPPVVPPPAPPPVQVATPAPASLPAAIAPPAPPAVANAPAVQRPAAIEPKAPKQLPLASKVARVDPQVYIEAISRLKVGAVTVRPEPRVVIDGRNAQFGDIVHRELAIRFMGVDVAKRMLIFTNADNLQFRRPY